MARSGRPSFKQKGWEFLLQHKGWKFLLVMQDLVDRGVTPNAAAVAVANKHWRNMPSKSYGGAVQWLKRYQREFGNEVSRHKDLLEFKKRMPKWNIAFTDVDLSK